MPSPVDASEKLQPPHSRNHDNPDIDTLNHRRALARQQQTAHPEQLHYLLGNSHELLSHW